jgi:hypothetical protein
MVGLMDWEGAGGWPSLDGFREGQSMLFGVRQCRQ